MTNEGGVFFKGMEIASATLTGKISTLKDNLALTAATIGTQLLPTIKPLLDRAIKIATAMREWINNNKEFINQRVQEVFKKITLVVQTLIKWFRPLVELIIKIVKEMVHMFTETENGKKVIKLLGEAFKLIATTVEIMWKIVKPILTAFLIILEPILDVLTAIIKATEFVATALSTKGPKGLDFAGGQQQAQSALLGKNDNVVTSQTTNTNLSTIDILLGNFPAGSTAKQTGKVPNLTLNTGFQRGRL